jgi:hypothetical protein
MVSGRLLLVRTLLELSLALVLATAFSSPPPSAAAAADAAAPSLSLATALVTRADTLGFAAPNDFLMGVSSSLVHFTRSRLGVSNSLQ